MLDRDRFSTYLLYGRIQQNMELPGALCRGDALAVALLRPLEGSASIGQNDFRAIIFSNARRCLERTVATADDQDVLPCVLLRIDEAIDDFG